MTEISALRQAMSVEGAMDAEGPVFEAILRDLEAGKLSPDEALARAHAINTSRGSYH
jgi:hypothetical protein